VIRDPSFDSLLRITNINQKDGAVKCNGVEKRIGLAEPDMPAYRRQGRKNEWNPDGDFQFACFIL